MLRTDGDPVMGSDAFREVTTVAMVTTPTLGLVVQQLANSDKARPRDDVLFNVVDVG